MTAETHDGKEQRREAEAASIGRPHDAMEERREAEAAMEREELAWLAARLDELERVVCEWAGGAGGHEWTSPVCASLREARRTTEERIESLSRGGAARR